MSTTTLEVVKIDPVEYGLDTTKAKSIEDSFLPKIAERDGYVSVYENILTKEITEAVCTEADELRKKLVKVRTGITAVHKVEKEFYLNAGRFVDAYKNKLIKPIEQMEEKLEEVSNHFAEQKRAAEQKIIDERNGIIESLGGSTFPNIQHMDQKSFDLFVKGLEAQKKEKDEADRLEAERIENERLEAAEKERVLNERKLLLLAFHAYDISLSKENLTDINDDQFQKLIQRGQKAKDKFTEDQEKLKIENEKLKKQAEIDAKIAAEKAAENERLRKQEADRKAAEEKAANEKAEAEKAAKIAAEKAAKAPVKEKLNNWVDSFEIKDIDGTGKWTLEQRAVALSIINKFEAYKTWAKSEIEKI